MEKARFSFPLSSLLSAGLEFLPYCFFSLFNSLVRLFKPLSLSVSLLSLCLPLPRFALTLVFHFHLSLAFSVSEVVNLPSRGPIQ